MIIALAPKTFKKIQYFLKNLIACLIHKWGLTLKYTGFFNPRSEDRGHFISLNITTLMHYIVFCELSRINEKIEKYSTFTLIYNKF